MYEDEIITEVWHNRDEYSKIHHYNLDEIVADLLIREQTHPDRVTKKKPTRSTAPTKRKASPVAA